MSDYDADYERRLVDEYNSLVRDYNREVERQQTLLIDVSGCQYDMQRSIELIVQVQKVVAPPLGVVAEETDKKEVIANNALLAINDLAEKYRLLSNGSTASKNLAGYYDKYYTYYGLYNSLREVSLGYVVGVDKNFWSSDTPRKTVEKMYLANTDYWLAYATMAVMLWASDEQEACERAIDKAMQMNEKKASLFFLLSMIRFNRMDAAREWYSVYFDLVDENSLGDEAVCLIQVLLSGALGADIEFAKTVRGKLKELLVNANEDLSARQQAQRSVDNYFDAFVSVTDKEYLNLKHICGEYDGMINLLSAAEKNALLKDYFLFVINSSAPLSDRLSERVEDALYALISANDDSEQELLDNIKYQELVVKANGDLKVADEAYSKLMTERRMDKNLILILINSVFDANMKADITVKKFALDFIRSYCLEGAAKFSGYRKEEKKEYDLNVDGCAMKGDENSFEVNKPKLQAHYDRIIADTCRQDKRVKSLKTSAIICFILFALFGALGAIGIAAGFLTVGQGVGFIVLGVVFIAAFVLCLYFRHLEKVKIAKSFEYRIANGMKMLEDGLKDMASWRAAYKQADGVYDDLIKVLKEEITNG